MEEETSPEILAARAKLRERFGQAQQLGGKGTARRKTKKVHKSVVADDKKLQYTLKRLGVATIPGIEEVLMMQDNGKLLQFTKPQVQAAVPANTYVISGRCEERSSAFFTNSMLSSIGRAAGGVGGVKFDPSLITPAMLRDLQQQMCALKMSGVGASGGAPGVAADDEREREVRRPRVDSKEKDASPQEEDASKQSGDDDLLDLLYDFEDVSKE